MKSIEDTLNLVEKIIGSLRKEDKVYIALIGGYAVIAHGVARTTTDVDFCVYANRMKDEGVSSFVQRLKRVAPDGLQIRLSAGSKQTDDPFRHDVIFFEDGSGQYPKMDWIVVRYQWELEGLKKARPLRDFPFPVLPKPYLVAMKLKAGGPKDDFDVIELFGFLKRSEQARARQLAKLIHREKNLSRLLKPRKFQGEDDKDLAIYK